jgi:2,4-dienoyl-CoA reductase [(3E)-enoyl-CoA-producing], peroxisomal
MPLGRKGTNEDCGSATVFLFSDAASWVTGQIFLVDGGHEHLRRPLIEYPNAVLDPEGMKKKIAAAMAKL